MSTNLITFKYKFNFLHRSLSFLFLLWFLFPLSRTLYPIIYKDNYNESIINSNKVSTIRLGFSLSEISNYIHITVKPINSGNLILYFSNKDKACLANRQLLSMPSSGKTELFLTRNQIINNNNRNFLCVESINRQNSSFTINLHGENQANLKIGDVYTYYIFGSENKNMTFLFTKKNSTQNSNNIITIWAKSLSPSVSSDLININNNYNKKTFVYGDIYSFKENSNTGYLFEVSASIGELVTVGSSITLNDDNEKIIKPNEEEIMGYLKKGFKEKECYSLAAEDSITYNDTDIVFLNGIIFDKFATIYYLTQSNEIFNQRNITDGNLIDVIKGNKLNQNIKLCIKIPDTEYNISELVYTFQILDHKNKNILTSITNSPLIYGKIYTGFLYKGQSTYYSSMQPFENGAEINYNLKTIIGSPDMFFYICENYPKCDYENANLTINQKHKNMISTYSIYLNNSEIYTPINAKQPLILINCSDVSQKKIGSSTGFCKFEASIFLNEDYVMVTENNTYSQFLLKNEKDKYLINLRNETKIKKLLIDLNIFTGDIQVEIESNFNSSKYYLANKIFYSINLENFSLNEIKFSVNVLKNSFYTIQYQIIRNNISDIITSVIESASYLQTIDPSSENSKKIIKFENLKSFLRFPFMVDFYSLNCKFKVNRIFQNNLDEKKNQGIKEVPINENYGYDIIKPDDEEYYKNYYYEIEIINSDVTIYNNKFCMIYVSGAEIETTINGTEREISIPENVPQQITFSESLNTIKYVYHLIDLNDPVIISLNLINNFPYEVKILYGSFESNTTYNFSKSEQIIIPSNDLIEFCEKDELCSLTIKISNKLDIKEVEILPKLDITVRQFQSGPSYLKKNELKIETLNGYYPRYFYIDIGQNETGSITINYRRSIGKIYGKIVSKNPNKKEDNSTWRGIYKFPSTSGESLNYDPYLKKLIINPNDTADCIDGCYILLTIQSNSNIKHPDPLIPQYFTIMSKIHASGNLDIDMPKVIIPINEYVIGNVEQATDEKIYEFYEVTLPYNAEEVYFDWQSETASLFVVVGDKRPTKENADFKYETKGNDAMFMIKKDEILNACGKKEIYISNLKNLKLNIGIWADKSDSVYKAIYAFKVHLTIKKELDVYQVNSDQKVQCKPVKINNNKYRCLYAAIFDGSDNECHLSVLARSQDYVSLSTYASLIDANYIENNDIEFLKKYVSTNESSDYNTDKTNLQYIFIESIDINKSLYISVVSNSPNIIELLSSTLTFDTEITPNPSTVQLFSIKRNQLKLDFLTIQHFLISIVSINALGRIYWEQEYDKDFYLRNDKQLSLTTNTSIHETKLDQLILYSNSGRFENDPGFMLYIKYYPRNKLYNCDLLKIGKSIEFDFRGTDFPLNFIVPINDNKNDIYAFLNFYSFEDNGNRGRRYMEKDMLKIWAKIITEDEAYKARLNEKNKPQKDNDIINGSFDGGLNVAMVRISKEKIENDENNKKKFLFFSVEKDEQIKFNFTRIITEVTVLQENMIIPVTENVYQYGCVNFNNNTHLSTFVLKINKNKPYMEVIFSANSNLVKWAISNTFGKNDNFTFSEYSSEFYNGKGVYVFKIPENVENELYLNVFHNSGNGENIDPKLGNFVFKYMNSENINNFRNYKVENDILNISTIKNEDGSSNYTIELKAAEFRKKLKVSYFIKGVSNKDYLNNELINTISLTESKGFVLQSDNPQIDYKGYTLVNIFNAKSDLKYIVVVAKIKNKFININDFVAYKPFIFDEPIELSFDGNEISQKMNNQTKKQSFLFNFNFSSNIPNFMKIQSVSDNIPSQILYFSSDDPNGIKNREQLSHNVGNKYVEMWLTKNQFYGRSKTPYFIVECANNQSTCSYKVICKGYESIEMDTYFIYNYYVTDNNKDLKFKVKNSFNPFLTFYAKGSNNINLSIEKIKDVSVNKNKFIDGITLFLEIPPNCNIAFFEFNVTTNPGDFISVGSYGISEEGLVNGNLLMPNGNEIFGYLKKNMLKHTCFNLYHLKNDEYSNIREIFISGIFENGIAEFNLKNEDDDAKITDTKILTENGSIFYRYILPQTKKISLCISIPRDINSFTVNDIPFSIQITTQNNYYKNIYFPQFNGFSYPRLIPKNSIVFFNGMKSNNSSNYIKYNMLNVEGFSKMYIDKCETFPLCEYNDTTLESEKIIKINDINRMSTYHTKEIINSPISNVQNVIIVKCLGGKSQNESYCILETSIFGDNDEILLIDKKPISQYILKGEQNNFVIDFSSEIKLQIQMIYLELLILSGDVTLILNNNSIKYDKYYLTNKIIFNINLKDNQELTKIYVTINASLDSYYELKSRLIREKKDKFTDDIYSGINYLVPVDPTMNFNKNLKLHYLNIAEKNIFLTNFYPLNCKYNIYRLNKSLKTIKTISFYNNYAQDILTENINDNNNGEYNYSIEVTEVDKSGFQNKICMLYVSGIELTNSNSIMQREIVISENVPQKIIFDKNNFEKVRYLYPDANAEKDIIIDFKVIDIAKYSITYIINYTEAEKEFYTSNHLIYLSKDNITKYCNSAELCPIIIEIKLEKTITEEKPMIEFSLRQVLNVPSYLPKNSIKRDFIINQYYLYLYTEIGNNEQGYITVNFLRGSGKIYGKIVEKKQETVDSGANWRQYKIPTTTEESLYYNNYEKKLYFTSNDTKNCEYGCYLLLSIQSSISGTLDKNYRFYPISIIASTFTEIDFPKVNFEIEEYAIGSLNIDKNKNGFLYEFYQVWLPYDSEKVEFDWQSDIANLYIYVGEEKPKNKKADFVFLSKWTDSIFEINKSEILNLAKNKSVNIPYENSIKYISLVIGVGTSITDSSSSAAYSFKVHLPTKNKEDLNILEVNSDQKTLCKPTEIKENEFRCLFIILYNEFDIINNLMIYAESQNKSGTTFLYANFIDKEIYETYNSIQLKTKIPTNQNSTYNSKKSNVNYIYISNNIYKSHLLVSVISDKENIIEFLSTFYTYDHNITPNPSTTQLFSITQDYINFQFNNDKDLLINLVSLAGEGEIYWETEPQKKYHLKGSDDRLTLTSKNEKSMNVSKLVIKNKKNNTLRYLDEMENPGFSFYISYYLRPADINFDEVYSGKTLEMAYYKADFPIYWYSKIENIDYDLSISLNFKTMDLVNKSNSQIIKSSDFNICSEIITENTLYKMKTNNDLKSAFTSSIKGVYDPTIRTAQIFLAKKDLANFKINKNDKLVLYFGMDKSKENNNINYEKLNAEISIIQENSNIPTSEKLYQHGKVGENEMNVYRLKNDKNTKYMRIQFSTNSDNVDFSINSEKENKNNSTNIKFDTKNKYGLVFIKFEKPNNIDYLYLNVFTKKNNNDKRLNNYAFKYINNQENLFSDYNIYKNDPKLTKSFYINKNNKKTLKIDFNKIENSEKYSIVYSLKYVPSKTYINNEKPNTIAVTESPNIVSQIQNAVPNENGKISLEIEDVDENFAIIQIIAQIMDEEITEYICYEPVYPEKIKNNFPIWLIVLICLLLLVIIVLIVRVIIYKKSKKEDLMDNVIKVSFVACKERSNSDYSDTESLSFSDKNEN